MEQFEGEIIVRRRRYASEGTGWAVLDAADADGDPLVLVGPLIHLEQHERARVVGTWVDDSRYGLQVKVSEAVPLPPADAAALSSYLRRVKHVGAKRAAMLVERHGAERVLEAVDRDPEAAFRSLGLTRGRAAEAAASWADLRVMRQLHILLAPHGLAYLASRLSEHYGPTAARVVSEHPYELTSVFGVGFLIADRIARSLGQAVDERERIRAAALHVLGEAERGGSTCMPQAELRGALTELLGGPFPADAIDELVAAGDLVRAGEWLYRAATAALEAELAQRVRDLVSGEVETRLRAIDDDVLDADSGLTSEQRTAVARAFTHRLSLITGGPGTGKTSSIKTIASLAAEQSIRLLLVAPTGRAAIRMGEASGMRSMTVHAALGWIPGEGPTHDEQDPVSCDLLILDESSMANLELLVVLLRAVPEGAHVVLVGDGDQLAPVGAGKPFAELVASEVVPTTHLTHIFRQAAGSMIVQGAHAIRRGEPPRFEAVEGMRRDLFLIERDDPRAARDEIVELVSERLPRHYDVDPVRDIQVFAPVYRGELGIDVLNESIRAALNPHGEPVRGGRLRIGDKVMLTGRNLHDLGLMNGTLLRLLDEVQSSEEDDSALILASEESIFRLPPEEGDRLRLAYACSVHRGQGIELPIAVIVAHPAAGAFFLRREMLYTALTRAKLATVVVGTRQAIGRAARTPDTGSRHSRLVERL